MYITYAYSTYANSAYNNVCNLREQLNLNFSGSNCGGGRTGCIETFSFGKLTLRCPIEARRSSPQTALPARTRVCICVCMNISRGEIYRAGDLYASDTCNAIRRKRTKKNRANSIHGLGRIHIGQPVYGH